ncbi:hypothetical protein HMP0015_2290 [Acinetobacter haemolyticus ATCC 19194]|uniref:Uncharacterized protein n=1 Tax=Acinetobacter haemolyticus ATCC 19194 TaxID=707232 RepID=D4XRE8_ACIHA|nr:hypothetical protein HMP0015_2290 [Acinetobacter haemolyticus ATCC 19194]
MFGFNSGKIVWFLILNHLLIKFKNIKNPKHQIIINCLITTP